MEKGERGRHRVETADNTPTCQAELGMVRTRDSKHPQLSKHFELSKHAQLREALATEQARATDSLRSCAEGLRFRV